MLFLNIWRDKATDVPTSFLKIAFALILLDVVIDAYNTRILNKKLGTCGISELKCKDWYLRAKPPHLFNY